MNLTRALYLGALAFAIAGYYMYLAGDPSKNYGLAGVMGTLIGSIALCSAIRDAEIIKLPPNK